MATAARELFFHRFACHQLLRAPFCVEFGKDNNGECIEGKIQEVVEAGGASQVMASILHKDETSEGSIERRSGNDAWCVKHPEMVLLFGHMEV